MPGDNVPTPTLEQLHEYMHMQSIKVQVFAQPAAISIGEGEQVHTENAWQWNVARGGSVRLATGHSEPTASTAFDKAWASALRIAREGWLERRGYGSGPLGGAATENQAAARPGQSAHGGYTNWPTPRSQQSAWRTLFYRSGAIDPARITAADLNRLRGERFGHAI